MNCCITDLHEKEIINLSDGCRLGNVCDVEIDTCSGCIVSIIVWGKSKCLGLLGKTEDIKICWQDIKVIGDDTILVEFDCPTECKPNNKSNLFDNLFSKR